MLTSLSGKETLVIEETILSACFQGSELPQEAAKREQSKKKVNFFIWISVY